jgi:hypothetical protein
VGTSGASSARTAIVAIVSLAAGVAIGAWALRPSPAPEAVGPSDDSTTTAASTAEAPRSPAPRDAVAEAPGAGNPAATAPSPTVRADAGASLASGSARPSGDVRTDVARVARDLLGHDLPPEYLDEAATAARRSQEGAAAGYAKLYADRVAAGEKRGELEERWEVVLQARSPSSVSVDGDAFDPRRGRSRVGTNPVDVRPLGPRDEDATYARWPLVPLGRLAVLEEVELRCELGREVQPGNVQEGSVDVSFPLSRRFSLRGTGSRRVRFVGSIAAWAFTATPPSDAGLSVRSAAASLVLRGRLARAGEAIPPKPPAIDLASCEGFYAGGRVRLQVRSLDGSETAEWTGRRGPRSTDEVYDERMPLVPSRETRVKDAVFSQGGGELPPGTELHVRRIEWRARLRDDDHAEMTLVVGRDPVVEVPERDAKGRRVKPPAADPRSRGPEAEVFRSETWTGDLVVQADALDRVVLHCQRGMASVVLQGEVLPIASR